MGKLYHIHKCKRSIFEKIYSHLNEPGIRKVQKVADYLHVSIEDLLEDNQEKGE